MRDIERKIEGQPRFEQACTPKLERIKAFLAQKPDDKRGAHKPFKDLIGAIETFLARQNADPKPLRWTKSADDNLDEALILYRPAVGNKAIESGA